MAAPPYVITSSSSQNLTVADFYSNTDNGYVISTSNFFGQTLTMANGFASALYSALGSPTLTNYTTYKVFFSCGNNAQFILATSDANLITTNSTTFNESGGVISGPLQLIIFNLTSTSPPQFTLYG